MPARDDAMVVVGEKLATEWPMPEGYQTGDGVADA
jgi:hypothetical protein